MIYKRQSLMPEACNWLSVGFEKSRLFSNDCLLITGKTACQNSKVVP
jgi:hypothetical protein